jgi:hypothetical protein
MTLPSKKPAYIAFGLGILTYFIVFSDNANSGFLVMVLSTFMAMCYLSLYYIPWKNISSWRKLIVRFFIACGINVTGVVLLSMFTTGPLNGMANMSILLAVLFITALICRKHLIPELPYIAVALWVLGLCNVPFNNYNWRAWIFSYFMIWPCMWVSVGVLMVVNKLTGDRDAPCGAPLPHH